MLTRPLEEIAADIAEARAALSRARQARRYMQSSSGGATVSVDRASLRELREDLDALEQEYARAERGGGIRVRGIVPIDG